MLCLQELEIRPQTISFSKPSITVSTYGDSGSGSYLGWSKSAYVRLTYPFGYLSDELLQVMLASEAVLGRDWNTPEEDAAWADL